MSAREVSACYDHIRMLVSVAEHGTRKVRNGSIRIQFIVESMVICFIGCME